MVSNDQETTLKTIVLITNGITSIVDKIQQFLNYWERKYKNLWDQDKDAYIRRYEKAKKPLNAFVMDITKHLDLQEEVMSEDAASDLKFLRIDCGPLKQALIGHCEGWIRRFTQLLHRIAQEELQNLHQYFEKAALELQKTPQSLDELQKAIQLHRTLIDEKRDVEARFDPLKAKYSTLERFEAVISDEELNLLDALDVEWEGFLSRVEAAQETLHASKDVFSDRINSRALQLRQDVHEDLAEFQKKAPYSDDSIASEDALHFLRISETQLRQREHQVNSKTEMKSHSARLRS